MNNKKLLDKIKRVRMSDLDKEELFLFPKNFYALPPVDRISTIKTLVRFVNKIADGLDGGQLNNVGFIMNIDEIMTYLYAHQMPVNNITEQELQEMITHDYKMLFKDINFISDLIVSNFLNQHNPSLGNYRMESDDISMDFKERLSELTADDFLTIVDNITDKTQSLYDVLEFIGLTKSPEEYFKILLGSDIFEINDFIDNEILNKKINGVSVIKMIEAYFLDNKDESISLFKDWLTDRFAQDSLKLIVNFSQAFNKEMDEREQHKNAICKLMFRDFSKTLRVGDIKKAYKEKYQINLRLDPGWMIGSNSAVIGDASLKMLSVYRRMAANKKIELLFDVMDYMLEIYKDEKFGGDYENTSRTPYVLMVVGMLEIDTFKSMNHLQKERYKELFIKMFNSLSYVELDLMFNIDRLSNTKYGVAIKEAFKVGFELNGIDYNDNKVLLGLSESRLIFSKVLDVIAVNKWMTDTSATDFYSGLNKTFNLNLSKTPKKVLDKIGGKNKPLIKFRSLIEKNILDCEIQKIVTKNNISPSKLSLKI